METLRLGELEHNDPFRMTERRLFRLPELIQRIAYNEADLQELREFNITDAKKGSVSLVSAIKPTMRVDPLAVCAARVELLQSYIAADKYEVRVMKRALRCIRADPYYLTVEYKYFRKLPDEDVASRLNCALTTIRRNRANLVRRISALLYGTCDYDRIE